MKNIYLIFSLFLLSLFYSGVAQKHHSDANIVGHVVCRGKHIAFASVSLKGTTIGTSTDQTGHFQLIDLPEGEYLITVTNIGYKSQEQKVSVKANTTLEIKFHLEEDIMNLEEVVVSADRSEQKRTEAPVIVNTIGKKIFHSTQSQTLGEGLSFLPGLRLENNCQNCGFTQVRMNGMEGPYSQILINSRPIFSGLAGVYGLEMIPSNMVEKIEVVRGGGSALYGSNAIAGTINIILMDPANNSYEGGVMYALTGIGIDESAGPAADYSLNFNTSVVSDDHKSGLSLYGFTRQREIFDANGDSFSELAPLKNLTFGTRLFHRFSHRDRLAFDFFAINEERDGGNMQDYPQHERDIAESLNHWMNVAGLTYEHYFRDYDMLSLYASGQFLNRDSYYGAKQSMSGYGNTVDRSFNMGLQYKAVFGRSSLVCGLENTSGKLLDKKLGYPDPDNTMLPDNEITHIPHRTNTIVADQSSVTTGVFAQYELKLNQFKAALGTRFDHYKISDLARETEAAKNGNVFSPRISLMYALMESLQARLSYSQGFRAPQIFDEDLHIETSGSRQVIHKNAADLKPETSHSLMASLDFNKQFGEIYTGFLLEAFYTQLENAFVNDFGEPDSAGTVYYTRMNSDGGASVQGLNMELKLRPIRNFSLTSGFTIQSSMYEELQDFNETHFFRAPDTYGFLAFDLDFRKAFCLSGTGNYTGQMLLPYFGPETPVGELRSSNCFFDMGLKLAYTVKLNGTSLEFSGGVKNIMNSYQDDFDAGIDRDPAYIYGPLTPRTIFIGLRFGNLLNREGDVSATPRRVRGHGRGQSAEPVRERMHRNRQ